MIAGSSGFSIALDLLLGKAEHQRAFFPWGKIEAGMESEGQGKCWNIFLLGLWFVCQKIAFQMEKTERSDCEPLCLYWPTSPSRCLVWILWASPNSLPHLLGPIYCLTHLPAARGWGKLLWNGSPCHFRKPSNSRLLLGSISRDGCISAFLAAHLPGRLVSVTCAAGVARGWIWTSPAGLVWACCSPGCLAAWAVTWEARFGFGWILLRWH